MGIFKSKGPEEEKAFSDNQYRTQRDATKDITNPETLRKLNPQSDEGKRAVAERLAELDK